MCRAQRLGKRKSSMWIESTFRGMRESSISVFVADEYATRRRTISSVLAAGGGSLHVVGEAEDFDQLLAGVETLRPHVLVVRDDVLRALRGRAVTAYAQLRMVPNPVPALLLTESSPAEWAESPLRDH